MSIHTTQTIPQAPRYSAEQLQRLVKYWRTHPALVQVLANKSDAEVIQYLRTDVNMKGFRELPRLHEMPPEFEVESEDVLKRRPEEFIDSEGVKEDNFDDMGRSNAGWTSWYLGAFGLSDLAPEWLGRLMKHGGNESLTGMAVNLIQGDEPFDLGDWKPTGIVEPALSMGFSLAYDFWFFALTRGVGLVPRLAGQAAKELAAKEIASIIMRRKAVSKAGTYGLEKLGPRKVKSIIKKDKKGFTREIDDVMSDFKKAGVDKVKIDALYKDSLKEASEYVGGQLSGGSIEFMKAGLTKYGPTGAKIKNVIDPPTLKKMFHEFGKSAAAGLGLYSAASDFEQQFIEGMVDTINPETGQPYDYGEALNIFEKWKRGDTTFLKEDFNYDFQRTAYAALHGYVGGYLAGGTGGVWRMGKLGAFNEKGWNKNIQKHFPKVNEALFSHFVGIPAEGTAFAVSGAALSFVDKHDDIPFGQRLFKDIVTMGILRGMHVTFDQVKKGKTKAKMAMLRATVDAKKKEIAQLESLKQGIDTSTKEGQALHKELTEKQKRADDAIEKDVKTINKIWNELTELSKKFPFLKEPSESGRILKKKSTATVEDINKLADLVNQIQTINDKIIKNEDAQPKLIREIMEDPLLQHFFDDIRKTDNTPGKLFRKIQEELVAAEEQITQEAAETGEVPKKVVPKAVEKEKIAVEEEIDRGRELVLEKERIQKEVGEDYIHKAMLSTEQLKGAKEHPQYGDFVKKSSVTGLIDAVGDTIVERTSAIEKEVIGKTAQKTIENAAVGNKRIDRENREVLEYVAKRKAKTGMSKQGGDIKEASLFARWLFTNKAKSIKNATKEDLQEYLDTGNNGNPFGFQGRTQKGRLTTNSQKRENILRWVKELEGIKGQGLSDVEALSNSTMPKMTAKQIVAMEAAGKGKRKPSPPEVTVTRIKEISKVAEKEGGATLKSGKKVSSPVTHLINYIIGIMGKRSATLDVTKLETDDIAIRSAKELIVTVTDKNNQQFILRVPNKKIMGVNYYKVFEKLISAEIKPILVDADGKTLTIKQVKEIGQKITGGKSVHVSRDNIYEIAAVLDAMGVKNSTGKYSTGFWSLFAQKSLVGHGVRKGDTAEKHYGKGYSETNELADIINFWTAAEKIKKPKFTEKELDAEQAKWDAEIDAKEQRTTSREPLNKESLERQVDEVMGDKKYPGFKVIITKDKNYAGKIKDGIIRLVEGKADETTIFHELVHGLEQVVRSTKNKDLIKLWKQGEDIVADWARRNDSKRWEQFLLKYKTKEIAANEYLTQLAAEWSVKRFNTKTKVGKFGNWVRELMSGIKNFFGVGSPLDISRAFGRMAERGFSLEAQRKSFTRYQKEINDNQKGPPATSKQMEDIENLIAKKKMHYLEDLTGVLDDLGLLGKNGVPTSNISLEQKGKKSAKFIGLTEAQAESVYNWISDFQPNWVDGRTVTWNTLNRRAHGLQITKGFTTTASEIIKKTLGIPHGSLKYATKEQLIHYVEMLETHGRKYNTPETVFDGLVTGKLAEQNAKFKVFRDNAGIMTLSVGAMLRKFGSKKVARAIEDHYLSEAGFMGRGTWHITLAVNELGIGNKGKLKFIPFAIDSELLKPYELPSGKMVTPEGPKGTLEFLDAYLTGVKDFKAGGKGTKESRAVKHIEDMYKYYWGELELLAKEKIPNPALYERWYKAHQENYQKEYFTHILTKEAREYFKVGSIGYDRAVEDLTGQIFDIKTKDLVKDIADYEKQILEIPINTPKRKELESKRSVAMKEYENWLKASKDPTTVLAAQIAVEANKRMYYIMNRKRSNVRNRFLLSRNPLMKNYVITKEGKPLKVWETNFDKAVGQYIEVFSNYLATVKHFNEFTDVTGDMSNVGKTQERIIKTMKDAGPIGDYMNKVVRRRIGMEQIDAISQPWVNGWAVGARYSALFGLSSPYSGIKNLSIGTMNTIGIHGIMPFMYGVSQVLKPSQWTHAQKKGWLHLGTKELNLTGFSAWWMKWISMMTPTEKINRVVGGFAGEYAAKQLVKRIRGEPGTEYILAKKWRGKLAIAELKKRFHFTDKDIIFLINYGLEPSGIRYTGRKGSKNDKMRELQEMQQVALVEKSQHYGHIKTQGATGDPFLPLWAGGGIGKSMTLFYRMAYSSTSNIYHHIIGPAKKGNFLPMARHTLAGTVLGSGLWGLYEHVLGSKPPRMNEDAEAEMFQNLAKTEALALWTFLLNPYASPGIGLDRLLLTDSIMQPALLRNSINTGEFFLKMLFGHPLDVPATIGDYVKNTIVVINHLEQALTKVETPYKTDIKNTRKFKNMYLKFVGKWDKENKEINPFTKASETEVRQQYRLIREAFNNNDLKSAARYYVATWYHIFDNERMLGGREEYLPAEANKMATRSLKAVMRYLNPMSFPDSRGKSRIDLEKEFLNSYLKPEEKAIAEKTVKQYHYRMRKFTKEVSKLWDHYGGMHRAGEVVNMFPVPPRSSFLGKKYDWKETTQRSKTAHVYGK